MTDPGFLRVFGTDERVNIPEVRLCCVREFWNVIQDKKYNMNLGIVWNVPTDSIAFVVWMNVGAIEEAGYECNMREFNTVDE